jgi:hypothetical protein
MVDIPFWAVASAIRVLITRARDWEANIASITSPTATVVVKVATCDRISRDMDDSK